MKRQTITIDEFIADVQAKERMAGESADVSDMIAKLADNLMISVEKSDNKFVILSDYDADGICSAYIMEKNLSILADTFNKELDIEVRCNDRRNGYGLQDNIQKEENTTYIICDMGCNQLDLIDEKLGLDNIFLLDHHLVENEEMRQMIIDRPNLCDCHVLNRDDEANAQYCATGLCYRVFEEISEKPVVAEKITEAMRNTLVAVASIGTATDVVDVMDIHGENRRILKQGIEAIKNADVEKNNFDYTLGVFLNQCGMTDDNITAHNLAFNVGSVMNAPSRMSSTIRANGAMLMYKCLTGDPESLGTYNLMNDIIDINKDRKSIVNQIVKSDSYRCFVENHKTGENRCDNIGVYLMTDTAPSAIAGIVAGKLAEATDKAIICLRFDSRSNSYYGSGRNSKNNETSLIAFLDEALSQSSVDIKYGGHENAIGISRLAGDDLSSFISAIEANKDKMIAVPEEDKTILVIPPETTPEELKQKLNALEPVGQNLKLPPVLIEGKESYKDGLFKAGNPNWKTVRVKDKTFGRTDVSDWCYLSSAYPQDDKQNISLLADISLGNEKYCKNSNGIEYSAVFDRQFLDERIKELNPPEIEQEAPELD